MSLPKTTRVLTALFRYFLLGLFLLITFVPLVWLGLSAFKENSEQYARPPVFLPSNPQVFVETLSLVDERSPVSLLRLLANSTVIAGGTTVLSIALGLPAAYAITRISTLLKGIPLILLCFRLIPEILILLPYSVVVRNLGLLDTHIALIVVYLGIAIPYSIWTIQGFVREIPEEIEQAAMIDGCSRLQMLRRIVFPLAAPGLVATGLFNFLFCWNEFLFALILTRDTAVTIPPMMLLFMPRTLRVGMMNIGTAAIVAGLSAIPAILLTIFLQRYLVRGLTNGAVKG